MHPINTPLSKLPALKPGCFLVLHGPQGGGKSTIARRIAKSRGPYAEINAHQLAHEPSLADAMAGHPMTLIVDEAECISRKGMEALKQLVTSRVTMVREPYATDFTKVLMPQVIVCCQDASKFEGSRRVQLHLVGGA